MIGGCGGLNVVREFGGFRGELGEIPNRLCYRGLTNHLDLEVVEVEDPHSPCFFIQLRNHNCFFSSFSYFLIFFNSFHKLSIALHCQLLRKILNVNKHTQLFFIFSHV